MELGTENAALKRQLASLTDQLHAAREELQKALEAEKKTQDLLERKEEMLQESQRELSTLRETLQGEIEKRLLISAQRGLKEKQLNEAVAKCRALEQVFKKELTERMKKDRELSSLQKSLISQKEETNIWMRKYEEVKAQRCTDLQEKQAECQRELTLKVISSIRSEIKTRTEENQILSATV
ncbi:golgin subfamily A member 6-like protein 6 [Lates japonicus]